MLCVNFTLLKVTHIPNLSTDRHVPSLSTISMEVILGEPSCTVEGGLFSLRLAIKVSTSSRGTSSSVISTGRLTDVSPPGKSVVNSTFPPEGSMMYG